MSNLTVGKINRNYLLAGLCALITLIPVLNYTIAVPDELLLTLVAWGGSNGLITGCLLVYSRWGRSWALHS
ncbi:MAG: hypothetical protein R3E79_44430 [Caldilineaceae bacterium]